MTWKNFREKVMIINCSRRKQYVEVLATHQIDGTVRPRTIIMADGTAFEIEEVKSVARAKARCSREVVLCYTIKVRGRETHLNNDDDRWFVEMKETS